MKDYSKEYDNFIDEDYIWDLIKESEKASKEDIQRVLDKAKEMKGLNHKDVAILLNLKDKNQEKELHETSFALKKKIYGDRVVLFAPLYIADYCVNNCVYCGYKYDNKFDRKKLSLEEISNEVKSLEKIGHKRLALEIGEDLINTDIDYILAAIKTIYESGDIRRINVNIAATDRETYQKLASVEIGTYILFQETYHYDTYKKMHGNTLKGDYYRQLFAHHRAFESGIDDFGGGVLFGLYDYRFDLLAMIIHNEEMLKRYGVEFHTMSFPRLKPAKGVDLDSFPYMIDDETFIKIISITRVAAPHVGMILSTRENHEMRMLLINQGISQISAGSKTTVGGYTNDEDASQFEVEDSVSLYNTIFNLIEAGNLPSYCTACYRMGRTGKEFHDQVETYKISLMCHPNAVLTTLEYILDYGDPQLYEIAYPFLIEQITKISDEKIKLKVKNYFSRIENGERDLYI